MAVIGAGAWGTALAAILAQREPVTLVCHSPETAARIRDTGRNEARLPGIDLPDGVRATDDPAAIAEAIDLVVVAVPSTHVRETLHRVATHLPATADALSVVKGIEPRTHLRMTQVIAEAGFHRTAARRRPVRAQPRAGDRARGCRRRRSSQPRTWRSPRGSRRGSVAVGSACTSIATCVGVELCGALKNIVAIAAGAADELGFGDNGKAGSMTRGLAEMTRVGVAAGANPLTFAGLAGIGDVIATCGSSLSRNHRLGVELARGRRWAGHRGRPSPASPRAPTR